MLFDDKSRNEVQRYCTSIAQDRLLVQAAGGNVSWKSVDTLWIKASGTWLADMMKKDIFVPVALQPLEVALEKGDYGVIPDIHRGYSLKPSIETLLHTVMPHKFVLHLHPVNILVHLIRSNCQTEIYKLINNDFAWEIVDYHKPGAQLARAVHKVMIQKPSTQVIFLKNHGVILGGHTIDEISKNLQILNERLQVPPYFIINKRNEYIGIKNLNIGNHNYIASSNLEINWLVKNTNMFRRICENWAICPDHVVFLGGAPICFERSEDLRYFFKNSNFSPPFIFVKDKGVIELRTSSTAQKAQLQFYFDVMVRQGPDVLIENLSQNEIRELLDWDAEKYRLSINI
jgi:rhamnose utilization protein RhaD (predicted bifunctional aldolase and dehydrogenase)